MTESRSHTAAPLDPAGTHRLEKRQAAGQRNGRESCRLPWPPGLSSGGKPRALEHLIQLAQVFSRGPLCFPALLRFLTVAFHFPKHLG